MKIARPAAATIGQRTFAGVVRVECEVGMAYTCGQDTHHVYFAQVPRMSPIETPANSRSRRTRSALLSAARDLLEEGGAEALTMSSVAERAGVTRRAVYLHFGVRA